MVPVLGGISKSSIAPGGWNGSGFSVVLHSSALQRWSVLVVGEVLHRRVASIAHTYYNCAEPSIASH